MTTLDLAQRATPGILCSTSPQPVTRQPERAREDVLQAFDELGQLTRDVTELMTYVDRCCKRAAALSGRPELDETQLHRAHDRLEGAVTLLLVFRGDVLLARSDALDRAYPPLGGPRA